MGSQSAISLIIPNLHSPTVGNVVKEAAAQAAELGCDWEIWVVGQDRYGQVPAMDRVRQIITPAPVWPAAARNMGAAAAQGNLLIFLDSDCLPQPRWLAELVGAYERDPARGAVSGSMLPTAETFILQCGQIAGFHEWLSVRKSRPCQVLPSFSLLMPRPVWNQAGGFCESLRTGEDLDLSLRVRQCGFALYFEAGASVYHQPARRGWRSLIDYAYLNASYSILVRRHHAGSYRMPRWTENAWAWRLLSPGVAIGRTAQIYAGAPGMWRYLRCAPWVLASKAIYCWGAAHGLARTWAESPAAPCPGGVDASQDWSQSQ